MFFSYCEHQREEEIRDILEYEYDDSVTAYAWERLWSALDEFPGSPLLLVLHGDMLIADRQFVTLYEQQKIISLYRRAADSAPAWEGGWRSLGCAYDIFLDDFAEAVRCIQIAIAIEPTVRSFVYLGRALAQQGRTAQALNELDMAIQLFGPDEELIEMRESVCRRE